MYAVKIDPRNPDPGAIASAADIIRKGGLVIFPTETVYGIAANLLDKDAVDRLYKVKERPQGKPFTVHISDIKMIGSLGCELSKEALSLISRFWPGPLTIILRSADGGSVGFRMPANKIAFELIRAAGMPIIAPSANLSGKAAPTSAIDAMKDFEGKVDMALDGGKTDIGVESTVIDMTVDPPKVLREGAIKTEELWRK